MSRHERPPTPQWLAPPNQRTTRRRVLGTMATVLVGGVLAGALVELVLR
jgi:hypothetical protein